MEKIFHILEFDYVAKVLSNLQPSEPPFLRGTLYMRPRTRAEKEWCVCQISKRPIAHHDWSEEIISTHSEKVGARNKLMGLLRQRGRNMRALVNRKQTPGIPWSQYWLTPPELYKKLDDEFHFEFDPCPYPRPSGFDGLEVEWKQSNYINPPFRKADALNANGPTAFAKKAIEEHKKGKTCVLVLPVNNYLNKLLEAGAEIRPLGRVQWLEGTTKKPTKNPSTVALFILRGKVPKTIKKQKAIMPPKIPMDVEVKYTGGMWTVGNFCPETGEYGLYRGLPDENGDYPELTSASEAELLRLNPKLVLR